MTAKIGLDLFGEVPRVLAGHGYAGRPGAGPVGETCRSCTFMLYRGGSYLKCGHPLGRRTHGAGTDIRASAPACEHWRMEVAKARVMRETNSHESGDGV